MCRWGPIFAELHTLQNDILIESAQASKEMWRSLNSVLGNKKENLACQVQDGERIISEPKAVASKFNKFFATTGCCIAQKLGSTSREELRICYPSRWWMSMRPTMRVSSKVVSKIWHSLKVNKGAGLFKIPAAGIFLVFAYKQRFIF